jgi:hypothetical protein
MIVVGESEATEIYTTREPTVNFNPLSSYSLYRVMVTVQDHGSVYTQPPTRARNGLIN